MLWVKAVAHTAFMINFKAWGNRTYYFAISQSMYQDKFSFTRRRVGIANVAVPRESFVLSRSLYKITCKLPAATPRINVALRK